MSENYVTDGRTVHQLAEDGSIVECEDGCALCTPTSLSGHVLGNDTYEEFGGE